MLYAATHTSLPVLFVLPKLHLSRYSYGKQETAGIYVHNYLWNAITTAHLIIQMVIIVWYLILHVDHSGVLKWFSALCVRLCSLSGLHFQQEGWFGLQMPAY